MISKIILAPFQRVLISDNMRDKNGGSDKWMKLLKILKVIPTSYHGPVHHKDIVLVRLLQGWHNFVDLLYL